MPDAITSTRTVADVKQHRLRRVAEHLRTFADRIEGEPAAWALKGDGHVCNVTEEDED